LTYTLEVQLREWQYPVAERVHHAGNDPARWTEQDVRQVLTAMLRAIGRVRDPHEEPAQERAIFFRGLSWIVSPHEAGVVLAVEIHSGAVVAGPFDIDERRLTDLVGRVLASPGESQLVH
jgi:hypothetical protein